MNVVGFGEKNAVRRVVTGKTISAGGSYGRESATGAGHRPLHHRVGQGPPLQPERLQLHRAGLRQRRLVDGEDPVEDGRHARRHRRLQGLHLQPRRPQRAQAVGARAGDGLGRGLQALEADHARGVLRRSRPTSSCRRRSSSRSARRKRARSSARWSPRAPTARPTPRPSRSSPTAASTCCPTSSSTRAASWCRTSSGCRTSARSAGTSRRSSAVSRRGMKRTYGDRARLRRGEEDRLPHRVLLDRARPHREGLLRARHLPVAFASAFPLYYLLILLRTPAACSTAHRAPSRADRPRHAHVFGRRQRRIAPLRRRLGRLARAGG